MLKSISQVVFWNMTGYVSYDNRDNSQDRTSEADDGNVANIAIVDGTDTEISSGLFQVSMFVYVLS